MAGNPFTQLVFDLFIISAILITAYTCNFYYLVFLANKRNTIAKTVDLGTPSVTIQLPIYNENTFQNDLLTLYVIWIILKIK